MSYMYTKQLSRVCTFFFWHCALEFFMYMTIVNCHYTGPCSQYLSILGQSMSLLGQSILSLLSQSILHMYIWALWLHCTVIGQLTMSHNTIGPVSFPTCVAQHSLFLRKMLMWSVSVCSTPDRWCLMKMSWLWVCTSVHHKYNHCMDQLKAFSWHLLNGQDVFQIFLELL